MKVSLALRENLQNVGHILPDMRKAAFQQLCMTAWKEHKSTICKMPRDAEDEQNTETPKRKRPSGYVSNAEREARLEEVIFMREKLVKERNGLRVQLSGVEVAPSIRYYAYGNKPLTSSDAERKIRRLSFPKKERQSEER